MNEPRAFFGCARRSELLARLMRVRTHYEVSNRRIYMKKVLNIIYAAKAKTMIVVSILTMLGVMVSFGQGIPSSLKVKIDNQFMAGGKTYPAGQYHFKHDNESVPWISVAAEKSTTTIKIITRLSRESSNKDGRVVFDKVGDNLVLSEVWLPGKDGYLVGSTNENHQHEVMKPIE
jgi:hypothetical protein